MSMEASNYVAIMKQALEALEFFEMAGLSTLQTVDAITSLRQAIAEAEKHEVSQEPVAWRNAALRVGEDLCSVGPFGYYDMTAEQWLDWALSVVTVHAPPQPQREPLTDEQIDQLVVSELGLDADADTMHDFARAIEAAHGIKEKNT